MFHILKVPEAATRDPYTSYKIVDLHQGPVEKCDACGGALELAPWLAPLKVELFTTGAMLTDVAFGPRTDLLVTEEFQTMWTRGGLKGLSGFEPVEVLDVSAINTYTGDERPYFRARVQRTDAALDDKESEAERTGGRPCDHCGHGGVLKHVRRVVLRQPPTEAVDLFLAKGLLTAVMASDRFVEAVKSAGISGCQLVPASEVRAL